MRLSDLAGSIGHHLVEEMKRLQFGVKNFPFHIHLKGHGREHGREHGDKFSLCWTTKAEHFGSPDRSDIASELYCQVVGVHDGHVLLNVRAFSHGKKYMGQVHRTGFLDDTPDWYKQECREAYFLVEAKAEALWTIMEAHADFDRVVKEVHES
jgi:hypothetical protein